MTTTVHLPARTAFRVIPTKAQFLVPLVMLIRIVPTDRFGIAIDTDAANFAALTVDPRRIAIGRIGDTTFGTTITTAVMTDTGVVKEVLVENVEVSITLIIVVKVEVGTTVVGATVVGATVVGATVVGATVVGATVVGATVVGATVVVGTTLRVEIAVAVETFDCVPIPSCPKSLSPQQRTSPVEITAHAWLVPATTSTTVPVSPVTAAGVSRNEPEVPKPN